MKVRRAGELGRAGRAIAEGDRTPIWSPCRDKGVVTSALDFQVA